jgi:threonine dehydratase
MLKYLNLKLIIARGLLLAFLANTLGPIPTAQADELVLPQPGVMVALSPQFNPPILKGLKVHTDNPFRFDFILDQGDSLEQESPKLIKYFLAGLTIPQQDLWVNLSPYEKNRIIPPSFGLTEMGRDLLAEDYILKQITASLIYPENKIGEEFWKRIYEQAAQKYGTTDIPVNTFNKVWIVPEKAVVYENVKAGTAYVVEAKLKVMLEEDYLALSKVGTDTNSWPKMGRKSELVSVPIIRQIVIPQLTKEVNEGKNFAQLRQVYNALILATWYKKKIKDSILAQIYEDKNKVAGLSYPNKIDTSSPNALVGDPEHIYQQYLKAFKKGAYNYIKEEIDPVTQQVIPRKYFSGGMDLAMLGQQTNNLLLTTNDPAMLPGDIKDKIATLSVMLKTPPLQRRRSALQIAGGLPFNLETALSLVNNFVDPDGGKSKFSSRRNARIASIFALYMSVKSTSGRNNWYKAYTENLNRRLLQEGEEWLAFYHLDENAPQISYGMPFERTLITQFKLGHKADKVPGQFALLEDIRLFFLADRMRGIQPLPGWVVEEIWGVLPKLDARVEKILFAGRDRAMSALNYTDLIGLTVHDWNQRRKAADRLIEASFSKEMLSELVANFINPVGVLGAGNDYKSAQRLGEKLPDFNAYHTRRNARRATLFVLGQTLLKIRPTGYDAEYREFKKTIKSRIEAEAVEWFKMHSLKEDDPQIREGALEENQLIQEYQLGQETGKIPDQISLLEMFRLFFLAKRKNEEFAIPGSAAWILSHIEIIISRTELNDASRKLIFGEPSGIKREDLVHIMESKYPGDKGIAKAAARALLRGTYFKEKDGYEVLMSEDDKQLVKISLSSGTKTFVDGKTELMTVDDSGKVIKWDHAMSALYSPDVWINTEKLQPDQRMTELIPVAQEILWGKINRTPLVVMKALSQMTGKTVLLKNEAEQRTGSFKIRGVLVEVERAVQARFEQVQKRPLLVHQPFYIVTQTTGNHGLAMIHAVSLVKEKYKRLYRQWSTFFENIQPVIFTLDTLPGIKRHLMNEELIQHDAKAKVSAKGIFDDRYHDYAAARKAREAFLNLHKANAVYMEHGGMDIMAGHASAGIEIVEQLRESGIKDDEGVTVIIPVGAGGPVGIAAGIKMLRPNTKIVLVQTRPYSATIRSLISGRLEYNEPNPQPTAIINGIPIVFEDGSAVDSPESDALRMAKKYVEAGVIVDDKRNLTQAAPLVYKDLEGIMTKPVVGGTTSMAALALLDHVHDLDVIKNAKKIVLFAPEGNVDPIITDHIRSLAHQSVRDLDRAMASDKSSDTAHSVFQLIAEMSQAAPVVLWIRKPNIYLHRKGGGIGLNLRYSQKIFSMIPPEYRAAHRIEIFRPGMTVMDIGHQLRESFNNKPEPQSIINRKEYAFSFYQNFYIVMKSDKIPWQAKQLIIRFINVPGIDQFLERVVDEGLMKENLNKVMGSMKELQFAAALEDRAYKNVLAFNVELRGPDRVAYGEIDCLVRDMAKPDAPLEFVEIKSMNGRIKQDDVTYGNPEGWVNKYILSLNESGRSKNLRFADFIQRFRTDKVFRKYVSARFVRNWGVEVGSQIGPELLSGRKINYVYVLPFNSGFIYSDSSHRKIFNPKGEPLNIAFGWFYGQNLPKFITRELELIKTLISNSFNTQEIQNLQVEFEGTVEYMGLPSLRNMEIEQKKNIDQAIDDLYSSLFGGPPMLTKSDRAMGIIHHNRLPQSYFVLPAEKFGHEVDLIDTVTSAAKEVLGETPLVSATGSMTYFQNNGKPDWKNISDIDILVYADDSRKEALIETLKNLKKELVLKLGTDRVYSSGDEVGLKDPEGRQYPIQLSLRNYSELFTSKRTIFRYRMPDLYFGNVGRLNAILTQEGEDKIIQWSMDTYKKILTGWKLLRTGDLKLLKTMYWLSHFVGKQDEMKYLSGVYVSLKSKFDENTLLQISSRAVHELEMNDDQLREAMTKVFHQDPAMSPRVFHTMVAKNGGIDLTEVKVDSGDKSEIKFYIDPAMLKELQDAPGFVPVIIHTETLSAGAKGMAQLRQFLGVTSSP